MPGVHRRCTRGEEKSYPPHFSRLTLSIHPTAFSFLYPAGVAGSGSAFQLFGRALRVLAVCRVLGSGERLRLSPPYNEGTPTGGGLWRNLFYLQRISWLIYPICDKRKLSFGTNIFGSSGKYAEPRGKLKIMIIRYGSKMLKTFGLD